MPKYRVRPGRNHGARRQYGPGSVVELTEQEARGFLDKLERIRNVVDDPEPEPEPISGPDVGSMTISRVLMAVDAGEIEASEALAMEKAGKNRATLVTQLAALIE